MTLRYKNFLAEKIQANRKALWDWHQAQVQASPPPFYCSIDLRDSGYKIAPVDSNLYPAGFNNICPEDVRVAPSIFKTQIDAIYAAKGGTGSPKRVLVLPEANTSNVFYIENIHSLLKIIGEAGFEARLGWWGPLPDGAASPLELTSESGKKVHAHAIQIQGAVLSAGDFVPDLVILNNDFSGGYPKELDAVAQPIAPSFKMGWHTRKKSEHFVHYNRLAGEFAAIIGVDPWLVQIDTEEVAHVNFNEDQGTEEVAQSVARVLARMKDAFERHKITRKPFVFVKNNSGTYGMGIMVVRDAEELRSMNRRTKNKMSVGKNRSHIESVAIQEGVPTATLVDRLPAEPVIYLCGTELIGGFLRTNKERGEEDNLNSQGMVFRKLCMSDLKKPEELDEAEAEGTASKEPVLELVYGWIARLSALAAGCEINARGV